MEAVRQKMIVFRYQLLHIGDGKKQITDTLQAVQPDIKQYGDIVNQLKAKIKERRVLLEERKTMPALQVFQHRKLAQKIAGLTEDIEELKSEKALLLNQFNCTDDHGMGEIKQYIASIESSLETLIQQEKKYTAEVDTALVQYAELQKQAEDMDAMELDTVRRAIRSGKERETAQRLQAAYGKKFDSEMLAQSRMDVVEMLDEQVEPVSIRQELQQFLARQDKHISKNERDLDR